MSRTFREWSPEQMWMFPPSPQDWLPENHLVYFLMDVSTQLDLAPIVASYDSEQGGQPPYHPRMMLVLLLYSYCIGVFSSRKIAARCETDVAFRVIVGETIPDFRTMSEYRRRHLEQFQQLFVEVLRLCQEAGLLKVGRLALDRTKVKANASRHVLVSNRAMSYGRMTTDELRLQAEIAELLKQAQTTDAAEDREHGRDQRGDELPAELARRENRLEKIREAKAALEKQAREAALVDADSDKDSLVFELDNVTCRLGTNLVLDRVSAKIRAGSVTFICGHSGSGKSTMLNLLGLLRPEFEGGDVTLRLDGMEPRPYRSLSMSSQTGLRSDYFGFVLQSSYLMPSLSGRRNIEMPLVIHQSSQQKRTERLERLLDAVPADLREAIDKPPHMASGGQQQRMSVLRALIHDPRVVLADEPCANLDPVNRDMVMELMMAWKSGALWAVDDQKPAPNRTLLIVSHDSESVVRRADAIAVLRNGRLVNGRVLQRAELHADPFLARQQLERLMENGAVES